MQLLVKVKGKKAYVKDIEGMQGSVVDNKLDNAMDTLGKHKEA